MRKLLLILAAVAIVFTADAKPRHEEKRSMELNVATYNV